MFYNINIYENCLNQLLNELRNNADLFENINEEFLDFLQLQINWTKQSKIVLDTFRLLQITLISSNPEHIQRYLSFLFTLFAIPENLTDHFLIYAFVHETLQQLIVIVPSVLNFLYFTIEEHFPFMLKSVNIQMIYIIYFDYYHTY